MTVITRGHMIRGREDEGKERRMGRGGRGKGILTGKGKGREKGRVKEGTEGV